jgi:hypothetical protein
MQLIKAPICPPHISKTAYFSLIWIVQCIYISFVYEYYILTGILCILSVTSVFYWSDCSNEWIRQIDICFAVTTLSVQSYIAITTFTRECMFIWFSHLGVSAIAYEINNVISTIGQIHHTKEPSNDMERLHYMTTYIHMFFIHFLPTITFSICVILSHNCLALVVV